MPCTGLEAVEELEVWREALAGGEKDDSQAGDAGRAGDHVHDRQLKFHRRQGRSAGDDVSGHDPRQMDESDGFHGIDGRHHGGLDRLPYGADNGLAPASAQCQQIVDPLSLVTQFANQAVETQRGGFHGVADDHPAQRDDVPRLGLDHPDVI